MESILLFNNTAWYDTLGAMQKQVSITEYAIGKPPKQLGNIFDNFLHKNAEQKPADMLDI